MEKQPRRVHVTLFVPGRIGDLGGWQRELGARSLRLDGDVLGGSEMPFEAGVEWVENPNDGSFAQAFSFGTVEEEDLASIDAAGGALVLSLPVDLHHERSSIASLARALSSCGALAVRIEESKLGFSIDQWAEMVDGTDPWSLYRVAVVSLAGMNDVATCGMQVFSLPDAHVKLDKKTDGAAAKVLLETLNMYQLAEDPLLLSGHTFSPDANSPRRVLYRWPDATYPSDHACHNPFGVWRVGAVGEAGEPPSDLAYVFMPSLAAVLYASEEENGQPLTREQVEELTSQAVCMTMEHSDAQKFERERGYADLDPEQAWDQWQIVRRSV